MPDHATLSFICGGSIEAVIVVRPSPKSIYLILAVVAVFFADRIIFIPPAPSYAANFKGLIRLTTEAGESVAALHYPASSSRNPDKPRGPAAYASG